MPALKTRRLTIQPIKPHRQFRKTKTSLLKVRLFCYICSYKRRRVRGVARAVTSVGAAVGAQQKNYSPRLSELQFLGLTIYSLKEEK